MRWATWDAFIAQYDPGPRALVPKIAAEIAKTGCGAGRAGGRVGVSGAAEFGGSRVGAEELAAARVGCAEDALAGQGHEAQAFGWSFAITFSLARIIFARLSEAPWPDFYDVEAEEQAIGPCPVAYPEPYRHCIFPDPMGRRSTAAQLAHNGSTLRPVIAYEILTPAAEPCRSAICLPPWALGD